VIALQSIKLELPPFFYDEKRARTPRWVIGFTSKLQVNKN
jgi:hypothetical protein